MKLEGQWRSHLTRPAPRRGRSGHAVVEIALISPWIFFLFVGALDLGFFLYALICTQNAARDAALYASSSSTAAVDSAGACRAALAELDQMPNVRGVSTCGALPVVVTTNLVPGVDSAAAASVSVTYRTVALIPIPRLLAKQMTITRTAQMRIR